MHAVGEELCFLMNIFSLRLFFFFFSADCEFDFKICRLEENIEQMKIYEIFTLRAPVF